MIGRCEREKQLEHWSHCYIDTHGVRSGDSKYSVYLFDGIILPNRQDIAREIQPLAMCVTQFKQFSLLFMGSGVETPNNSNICSIVLLLFQTGKTLQGKCSLWLCM